MPLTPLRRVLAATGLSDTANGVFTVAAVVTAAQVSGSPAVVAAVTAASTLPWLLFAVPAGMLVDSVRRSSAMTYANLVRGCVMLAAAACLASGAPAVPVLIAAVFLVASLQTVVDTAAGALVPVLVPADRVSSANGALAASPTA
ncbi:MAG: MFS transporter [Actinomycetota bacterium]|nr:MFS transporter [Actinomycetota bacterium]